MMKDFIITILFWIFFWIPFWPIYSALFWAIYSFDFYMLPPLTLIRVIFWGIGGVIGAVIGGVIGAIFLMSTEEATKRVRRIMRISFWVSFWTFFWIIFLSLLAGIFMQSFNLLITSMAGTPVYSSLPILIFGANGAIIGELISEEVGKSYFKTN